MEYCQERYGKVCFIRGTSWSQILQNKPKGLKLAKEELRLIGLMVIGLLDRIGLMVNRHDG